MNINDDILIEKYLDNTLSAQEKEIVVTRMENDPIFKEKVSFEKQLLDTFSKEKWSFIENTNATSVQEYSELFKKEGKLKQVLKEAKTNYNAPKKKTNFNWYLYASAAMIVLLIAIVPFVNKSSSSTELYASYLNTTELPSLSIRGNENKDVRTKAQHLFEQKKYKEALVIFNSELDLSKKQTATVYLYMGIAQMEINQFEKAVHTFDALINSGLMDAPKGHWYKALLYLKMKKIKDSKVILNSISSKKLYNYQQANDLLKALD
ncbi:MAG: hypothetical protein HRT69_00375 [Flavobacteriaceae bacterium]|nr:hypothetical protein [Flavobacteriaceae bacterium]